MKWVSHMLIAGSTTAVFYPPLVPVALAGCTAPDWLEWVFAWAGRPVAHRTTTHYVSNWVLGLLFAFYVWDFHHIMAAFFWGGLTHVLCDALTIKGVPLWPGAESNATFFGGRIKTGDSGEFVLVTAVVLACIVFTGVTRHSGGGFTPFFYDWVGMYEAGIVDAKEWKENRFRFF